MKDCSSKCQPLSWTGTTTVQFLFSWFLSGSFCSYLGDMVGICSPSDGADALLTSTQLTGSLCSRVLKGSHVCPSHLLTQLTTSPTNHFTCCGLILQFMLFHDELLQVEHWPPELKPVRRKTKSLHRYQTNGIVNLSRSASSLSCTNPTQTQTQTLGQRWTN